jgi:HEAT repeat protein
MASRPDASWLAAVRELTGTQDAETRATAAGLLAPHDPDAAARVLDPLMADANPAIRDLAAQVVGETATTSDSLGSLRRILKAASPRARVRAAARVLTLTR